MSQIQNLASWNLYTHITSSGAAVVLPINLFDVCLKAFQKFPYPKDIHQTLGLRTSCDAGSSPKSMAPANQSKDSEGKKMVNNDVVS